MSKVANMTKNTPEVHSAGRCGTTKHILHSKQLYPYLHGFEREGKVKQSLYLCTS